MTLKNTTQQLKQLEQALMIKADICTSWGSVTDFPKILKKPFRTYGISLIVCSKGSFSFTIESEHYSAKAGETVVLPDDVLFYINDKSKGLKVHIFVYEVENIRDILGNLVQPIQLYIKLTTNPYYVLETDEGNNLIRYIHLLEETITKKDNLFLLYEQKLLLLSLTYKLCSIFQQKFLSNESTNVRRTKVFLRLVELIDKYYKKERGVEFYANKLCVSAKYLSVMSKSVCGYTVQELVFKAIIRKSKALLNGTTMTVQQISDEFNFPNASSFGTFFKKQIGVSPQKYRDTHPETL